MEKFHGNKIRNIFAFTIHKQKQPLLGVNGEIKLHLFIDEKQNGYIY